MVGIAAHFAALHRQNPQRPLIMLPELQGTLTASDIWRQHHEFLGYLGRLNLQEGDLLMCGIGNRPELLAVLLACRVHNVTLMAVDTGATPTELQTLCRRFGAKALLTSAAITPEEGQASVVARGLTLAACRGESASYPDAAVLKLTSGTSGLARAVRTTEAQSLPTARRSCRQCASAPTTPNWQRFLSRIPTAWERSSCHCSCKARRSF